jgi:hypothetical protein
MIVKAIILIAFSLFITGCGSSYVTDNALSSAFGSNRTLFDEIAVMSMSGELKCPYPNDPDICEPTSAAALLAQLKRATGFKSIELYVKKRPARVLWIPVQTRGYLSINSSNIGYVYSSAPLSPLVGNTWQDFEDRQAYKNISGSWYLFVAN